MSMICQEAQPLLAELSGETATPEAGSALEAARQHASGCADCGRRLGELSAAVRGLRQAGEVSLPAGFERELHQKLVAVRPALPLRVRLARFCQLHPLALAGAAAAVSALLATAGTTAVLEGRARPPAVASAAGFRLPLQKVALVKIDFASEKAIDDVNFEVVLPEGLHFYSGGQELSARSFQWQGKLSSGSNVVPIAVKGSRAGRYRLVAHATGRDLDVSEEVVLEVTT